MLNFVEYMNLTGEDYVKEWKLKSWQIAACDAMNELYRRQKISGELHQTMIEVINKCPAMEHLTAIMDSFGYRTTITTIYRETSEESSFESSESWTNE